MPQEIEFTDRYQALGIPYPDPETMCKGECDGVGFYPFKVEGYPTFTFFFHGFDREFERWVFAHTEPNAHKNEPCNGWHFIKCPDCEGTGKQSLTKGVSNV